MEPTGTVRIDGVHAGSLGLQTLRGALSIIPQEPFLTGGTLRGNLDPWGRYQDPYLWEALEKVAFTIFSSVTNLIGT